MSWRHVLGSCLVALPAALCLGLILVAVSSEYGIAVGLHTVSGALFLGAGVVWLVGRGLDLLEEDE